MGEKPEKQALILIYTGEGKGKTSAAIGQAIRALGAGLRVGFGQFLKRDFQAGEQKVLKQLLPPDMFLASGAGFFLDGRDHERHRARALSLLDWAMEKLEGRVDLLVLDEVVYALGKNLITPEELANLLDQARKTKSHLVLTGRNVPEWLADQADLISDIRVVKHHFEQNIPARKGIEY